MTWWQALILGIVEGLTEYVPVSSTGHLILTTWLLGLYDDPEIRAATDSFNIIIQSGAIAAVAGLYWRRIVQMSKGLVGRDDDGRRLLINLVLAFMPAAMLGPIVNDPIKHYLFSPWPVIGALFVGAWLMLAVAWNQKLIDRRSRRDLDQVDWRIALMIGLAQCIAMWPGTSRSMITIVAALMLGLRPRAGAEFSFLLGLITLSAATCYDAYHGGEEMIAQLGVGSLIIGFVAATIAAAVAVKWFVGFLTRRGLAPFGWYRLGLATLLTVLIATGVMELPDLVAKDQPTPDVPIVEPVVDDVPSEAR